MHTSLTKRTLARCPLRRLADLAEALERMGESSMAATARRIAGRAAGSTA